jgi:DNA-binding NarL/FixJ family response regulator
MIDVGRPDEATVALELAASLLPEEPPTVARAVVLASLASRRMISGELEACGEESERAVAAARAAGAREQEANALITLGVSRAYLADGDDGVRLIRASIELAEADGNHTTALRGFLCLSDVLEMLGDGEQAAETAAHGLALASGTGLTRNVYGIYLAFNLAESLFHLGRWRESARHLTDVIDSAEANRPAGALLHLRGTIAVLAGRLEDAAADIEAAAHGRKSDEDQFTLQVEFARAELARSRGDIDAAREIVRQVLADFEWHVARYQWPVVWLGLRLEAEAAEPVPERLAALSTLADSLAATTPDARGCRALAAAEAARATGEPADWAHAVSVCRGARDPYRLAYALLRQADAACAAGDRDEATAALREAARMAEDLGAIPLLEDARALARRARVKLDDADALEPGIDGFGLTEREREVLELLAEGWSNPQIAAELFISPKTASVHVSNILGKLRVTGRGEAAAIAHRHGLSRAVT